jgi:hypothetical protein
LIFPANPHRVQGFIFYSPFYSDIMNSATFPAPAGEPPGGRA